MQPSSNFVTNLMWPIVLFGGLGVFIDFVLGAAGQKRVKDRMTDWWVKFEYTNWQAFSGVEAQFFIELSDRLFGQRLLSRRRLTSCAVLLVIFYSLSFIRELVDSIWPYVTDDLPRVLTSLLSALVDGIIDSITLALALSLNRAISVLAVKTAQKTKGGPLIFLALVLIHIALTIVWLPILHISAGLIKQWPYLHSVEVSSYSVFMMGIRNINFLPMEGWPVWQSSNSIGNLLFFAAQGGGVFLGMFANYMRLLIAIFVLFAVVFGRWLRPMVSLIWRRLIEDQKGVFTLTLGAVGALAGILKEVASRF